MSYNNHCPYCQASVSGPFHTNGRDSVCQDEINELKQENMELRYQLALLLSNIVITINDLNRLYIMWEKLLPESRTDNEN